LIDGVAVGGENVNLDDIAQRYAGAKAAIEATSNYYHIHDTLSEIWM
jgi:hypothetical protein